MATLQRGSVATNLNQSNVQPVLDIYASVQGRDLGSISGDISKIVTELQKELKPGNTIQIQGQIQSMHEAFSCRSADHLSLRLCNGSLVETDVADINRDHQRVQDGRR